MYYIFLSCLISDTTFILLVNQLKTIICTCVYLKAVVIFYSYPSLFFFDTIFILLVDQLKNYIRTYAYFKVPDMFMSSRRVLFPIGFFFFLLVDQLKIYLNPRLSQSTRHVLHLPVMFISDTIFSLLFDQVKNIFEPTSISKQPSRFIYTRHFLFPIRFLSFSLISLTKLYLKPHQS